MKNRLKHDFFWHVVTLRSLCFFASFRSFCPTWKDLGEKWELQTFTKEKQLETSAGGLAATSLPSFSMIWGLFPKTCAHELNPALGLRWRSGSAKSSAKTLKASCRLCRYRNVRPHSLPAGSHSFVGMARETAAMPPALLLLLERERKEERKREKFLHLFRCYTHTHPAGAGSTLKGKRKKKADTDDGPRTKTAQGGKGTDGPPEPTYTAKQTWQKTGHTPKPHNTLRRSREGRVI